MKKTFSSVKNKFSRLRGQTNEMGKIPGTIEPLTLQELPALVRLVDYIAADYRAADWNKKAKKKHENFNDRPFGYQFSYIRKASKSQQSVFPGLQIHFWLRTWW